ncbi:AEC family transporter [Virgibacillus proomii]|uniref:AEC family transporter n=1 Tax=Virgibacillus proomii TaxID=84407 RepID=UPI001C11A467|nr:AEC family transporter [Virgibacillus proomii]MBU5267472.1 AEC family transporter [Virgibacillus proomii]
MDILQEIQATFTDMKIVSAITSVLFIILLGYFCHKQNIFSDTVGKALSRVVLVVPLPALAFNTFMEDIDAKSLSKGMGMYVERVTHQLLLPN